MKSKYLISIFIAVVLISFGLYYFINNGNPISNYQMTKNTEEYLVGKGYEQTEIKSIHSTYDLKRNTERIKGTVSYVVFTDEPNIKYEYIQWKDSNNIQQACPSTKVNLTHKDKDCTEKY